MNAILFAKTAVRSILLYVVLLILAFLLIPPSAWASKGSAISGLAGTPESGVAVYSTLAGASQAEKESNDTLVTANVIKLGDRVSGSVSSRSDEDCFKFTLDKAGCINVVGESFLESITVRIYDAKGNDVWRQYNQRKDLDASKLEFDWPIDFTAGTYYISIESGGSLNDVGNYNFKLGFTSANESFKEVQGGSNNTSETASQIELGRQYHGQIAVNDKDDYYKFTLKEGGKVFISGTSYLEGISAFIYDSNGRLVWGEMYQYRDPDTKKLVFGWDKDLPAGTYRIAFQGGGYNATGNYNFTLYNADIAQAIVSLPRSRYPYTGSAIKPLPSVKLASSVLEAGTDYTVSYKNNVNAGTATVTVTGKGDYTGSASKTFKIAPASVAKAVVTGIVGKTYDGKAQTQTKLTVKVGGRALKYGTDYAVSYKNNVKAGTATFTVTGKGNYAGSVSKTFRIVGWTRLWGQGSLDTMAEISKAWGSAKTAVVATNADFKDTLAAIGLAGSLNCPVLVTSPKGLSAQTRGELTRMGVKTVYVMGGTGGVTAAVENAIKALPSKPAVKLIAGKDAQTKSIEASKAMPSRSKTVIITRPLNFGDALSISPYAYATKSPVIYTDPATGGGTPQYRLSNDAVNYIKSAGFTHAVVVGGIYAVPESVLSQLAAAGIKPANVTRLAGNGAYETSRVIGEWATGKLANGTGGGSGFYKWSAVRFQPEVRLSANDVGVSRGDDWKDALCGSALCGKKKSILLLASKANQANAVVVKSNKASVVHGYVFGGNVAVPEKVVGPFRDAAL